MEKRKRNSETAGQGCDVWLNNPRRPYEACGTSGQKVAVNGGLNLSVADGWWCEGYNGTNGWTIGPLVAKGSLGPEQSDYDDAASLYSLLEDKVVPLYFERDGVYWEKLDAYEEEGLEQLAAQIGKRRKKRVTQIKRDNRRTHKRISRTDPEAGHMKRPGKPEGPHYLSHQAVDSDYGIIVGQTVTPGDVNDSAPYLDLMEYVHTNVVPIQIATADAAYDFPLAHRVLGDLGINFFVRPQKTAVRTAAQFTRDDFHYDEGRNVYLCPGGKDPALARDAELGGKGGMDMGNDLQGHGFGCLLHDELLAQ